MSSCMTYFILFYIPTTGKIFIYREIRRVTRCSIKIYVNEKITNTSTNKNLYIL